METLPGCRGALAGSPAPVHRGRRGWRLARPLGLASLVLLLASAAEATPPRQIGHVCNAKVVDAYDPAIGRAGVPVEFLLEDPLDGSAVVARAIDYTAADGRVAIPIFFDEQRLLTLRCRILPPPPSMHRVRAKEAVSHYVYPGTSGGEVAVQGEMAPDWNAEHRFPGLKTGPEPDHGWGHAMLYMGKDGIYDRVVIIPQGMDFFEAGPNRQLADEYWFSLQTALVALHDLGFDVWMFRPHLTGQNVHEQTAEFAQAIQYAADYQESAIGGKVIVAGYSLGAAVARLTTARWEADPEWRASLNLAEQPPVHLLGLMDGALRGANVNLALQRLLWQSGAATKVNLASCAASQLIRRSTGCADGSSCHDAFQDWGQLLVFEGNQGGTCDQRTGDNYCLCDAGPALSTVNGDGFAHTMPVYAFSAGTWSPGFSQCYGIGNGPATDLNSAGQDVCPSDPGGDGPYVPLAGDDWWSIRAWAFDHVLESWHLAADPEDLAPGSRFTIAFQEEQKILELLPKGPGVVRLESLQNFAFTFIPIDSALAADSPGEVPFAPGHTMTATYQAVHNRPPAELLGWLISKFAAVFGGGPTGPGGGGLPPRAPGNLTADPMIGGWDQVDLHWEDRSDNEDHFEIWRMVRNSRAGDSDVWTKVDTVPADSTSFHDDGNNDDGHGLRVPTREEGTLFYFYKVKAVNAFGSGESNRADVNLYEQPPEPSTALRPRGCITDLIPVLSWAGGQRSSKYYVRLLDGSTGTEAMPDIVTALPGVRPGRSLLPQKAYLLRVWGMNNVGWGSGSNPEYFRTFCGPVEPPQVLEPAGCIDTATPTIRWTAVPGAIIDNGYHLLVHRVVDVSNDVVVIDTVTPADQTEYRVTQPLPSRDAAGRQIDYRVKVQPNTGSNADPYSRIRFFSPLCDGASSGAGFASPIAPDLATSDRPEFIFEPAARADSYRIEVYNETGTQLVYARAYAAANICRNGLCSVRPDQSLAVGRHAWWVKAGRGLVFDPYAIWAWVQVPLLPSISIGSASANEASGALSFPISLSAAGSLPVTFSLRTEDGTAIHGADFAALDGSWTIPLGGTSLTVIVPLVDDAVNEATETLRFRLSAVTGALVGNDLATGTIVDDDPVPQLFVGDAAFSERGPENGEAWAVPVRLVGQSDRPVTATVSFGSCTADADGDFSPNSQVLTFAPGETEKQAKVEVHDDALPEGHEVIAVSLDDADGAVVAESRGEVTIVNDDVVAKGIRKRGRKRSDFDGDGNNDIVWQDPATRALSLWRMVGVNRVETVPFSPSAPVDAAWKLAGIADFNADGKPDLLWRNEDTGRLVFWLMNGVSRVSAQLLEGEADLSWKVVGTGYFNGDASPDLLWRNDQTGQLKVWMMQGLERQSETATTPAAAVWSIQGIGDFDGDGQDDILWLNTDTGNLMAALLNGVVPRDYRLLSPSTRIGWAVATVLDVDADGTTDLIWTRSEPDRIDAWLMRGTTMACSTPLAPHAPDVPIGIVVGPR